MCESEIKSRDNGASRIARGTPSRRSLLFGLFFAVPLISWPAPVGAAGFLPEEKVATGDYNFRMSHNPNHSMVVNRGGTVHLVFWSGYLATLPGSPSAVWYATRSPDGLWSQPLAIDDSYISTGTRLGGRHPSLIVTSDTTVRVFWHDYRHCTGSQNWMDNTEIYMDTKQAGGSFSADDVRLTETSASHDGDNAYLAKAAVAPDGRIYVTWYDFHFNPNCSDIFLARSQDDGRFEAPFDMERARLTDASERDNRPSYTMADIAIDTQGAVHLVWTKGLNEGLGVFYARVVGDDLATGPLLLTDNGGSYWDPPRITAGPNGDVVVLWTEMLGHNGTAIVAARLRRGAAAFEQPAPISASPDELWEPDGELDTRGLLHLVWIERKDAHSRVVYGVYDFGSQRLIGQEEINGNLSDASRPVIALDSRGFVHIAWEDFRSGKGQIYYRTSAAILAVRPSWTLYH